MVYAIIYYMCLVKANNEPHGMNIPSINQAELDKTLHVALEAQNNRERAKFESNEHLTNENSNKGLINTIVNHNKKIKNIENKFNYIVNNFANSSHVKEVVEKTKEIENHVFGPPRPHSSWRELLLMLILLGGLGGTLIIVAKKYLGPRLIRYVNKRNRKTNDDTLQVTTISGSLPDTHRSNNMSPINELKIILDHHIENQNKILNEIINELKNCQKKEREPIGNM